MLIEGVGEIMAADIHAWFEEADNQALLESFRQIGLWPVSVVTEIKENLPLEGLSFVITGTLPSLSREQAEELIKKYGGKVVSSISKNTDYLVLGENPGSKHTKALQLGIQILNEQDLKRLIGLQS